MKQAFTLIELLVVVLIIGILSAIALPQYRKAVYKSRATQAKVNLSAIAKAQQVFYLTNGYYTPDLTLLDVQVNNSDTIWYSCNINTDPDNADCWANMSELRYNFSVSPRNIGHYCACTPDTWGEEICKTEGTYSFDSGTSSVRYYQL